MNTYFDYELYSQYKSFWETLERLWHEFSISEDYCDFHCCLNKVETQTRPTVL